MPASRIEIGELWRKVNRATHDRFRQAFRGSDLPFASLFMLRQIHRHPGLTVGDLARRVDTVKSHVSKMVDQLVQQGYLEKRADETDHRLVRIYATERARGSMAAMEARAQRAWLEVMQEVPESEVADVERGLRILLTALEKAQGKVTNDQGERPGESGPSHTL